MNQSLKEDGREDKLPWSRWFWQDWESDIGLQLCSLAAQGLWMQMLSIMARAKNKGYLLDGEKQMETKMLAKKSRSTVEEITPLIEELENHNVFSRLSDGTIFNRRMKRESHLSKIRSEAGKLGGRGRKQSESKGKAPSASASEYASISASEELDDKSIPPIPKNFPFKIQDELRAMKAHIKERERLLTEPDRIKIKQAHDGRQLTPEILKEEIEAMKKEFRQKIEDYS